MAEIRLAVIGMSEGNGHPYSWSAIFNGYLPPVMAECSFPSIGEYLALQSFPEDCISGARVTHIWTQDKELSRHIAKATFIDHIAETPEEMIGQIDGVLLARDDAENHRQFAEPFIEAGLPIYVDKPFAHSRQAALDFFALEVRPGQIFSCSALRFAREMLVSRQEFERIGGVARVVAKVPKSWEKYAIHVIDPILVNCGPFGAISNVRSRRIGADGSGTEVVFELADRKLVCEITAYGTQPSPISVEYVGPSGTIPTRFKDSFGAFKSALAVFVEDGVIGRRSHAEHVLGAIDVLELGI